MGSDAKPLRVLRVLPTLEVGGTEVQCVEVLDEIDANRDRLQVHADLATLFQSEHPVLQRRRGHWRWHALGETRSPGGIFRARRKLALLVASGRYDVVHALLWPAMWAAAAPPRHASGAPVIGSIHSSAWPSRAGLAAHGSWSNWVANQVKLTGHFVAGSGLRALVFNSASGRRALAADFGWREQDAEVIPNGKAFVTREPQQVGRSGVLCAARVIPSKRQDLLIAALQALPSLPVDFVGEGTDGADFIASLAPLGARAHGHGAVSDVAIRLQRAGIAALPTEHEGLPNAVIEAWGQGATVIASRVPGVAELVRDNLDGLLVDNTVDAWAAGLRRLHGDEELRTRLARAGYARVLSDHSLGVAAERWSRLYLRVASGATAESWPPKGRSR